MTTLIEKINASTSFQAISEIVTHAIGERNCCDYYGRPMTYRQLAKAKPQWNEVCKAAMKRVKELSK